MRRLPRMQLLKMKRPDDPLRSVLSKKRASDGLKEKKLYRRSIRVMAIRRKIIPTVILAAFIVLSLPAMAAAQGNNPWWGNRDNGRGRQTDDYYSRYNR